MGGGGGGGGEEEEALSLIHLYYTAEVPVFLHCNNLRNLRLLRLLHGVKPVSDLSNLQIQPWRTLNSVKHHFDKFAFTEQLVSANGHNSH